MSDDLTCQGFTELITDYLEGALPDGLAASCAVHVSNCPHCTAYLEQMRQTIRVLGAIIDETVSVEARRQLIARFKNWAAPTGGGVPVGEDRTTNPLP